MSFIDKILEKLETCIETDSYKEIETEIVELKPMPPTWHDSKSLLESVCAFLNTNGGTIIIGIKQENNPKRYRFTGYKEDQEENIKKITKAFRGFSGEELNISEYVAKFSIKDFLNGRVGVLDIDVLPAEKKYAFYNGFAYERRITGDHIIPENKISAQEEYKEDIIRHAKELEIIRGATTNDLDVDKLNEFIQLLNKDRETKIETIKSDIEQAKSFLTRKKFLIEDRVTLLGMLVCGKHPEDFLGNKCEVDCYVESAINLAESKKIISNTILSLMESAERFVYKNIRVGVSVENGGKSVPEYPENLIREGVNNSLAHRDYSVDKFVTITIVPGQHIEIRNPGSFKKSLLIEHPNDAIPLRRIKPDQKSINPRLADILKVYNKMEARGIGIATLTNTCMKNLIDLPYYKFISENELALVIRKGKLLDEDVENLFLTFDRFLEEKMKGEEITEDEKLVIAYFYKSEIENQNFRYTILYTPDNNHLNAIQKLERNQIIYKHPSSDRLYPIYVLHRELMKKDYHNELRAIFGYGYDALSSNDYRDVLKVVYQANKYSKQNAVSASFIGNKLYYSKYKNVTNFRVYDNFKRKIRNIVIKLKNVNFLVMDGKKYLLNEEYQKDSLFDA